MELADTDAGIIERSMIEPSAFAAIFDRHYTAIHRYAARRIGTARASDVAGEVFLVAFDRRRTFRTDSASARPWLFGIASNLIRRERGRFARRRDIESDLDEQGRAAPHGDAIAPDGRAEAVDLRAALQRIDSDDRELVLLVAWDGFSYEEAAEHFGVPVGTIRSRLHRAKARLRELLDPHLIEETSP